MLLNRTRFVLIIVIISLVFSTSVYANSYVDNLDKYLKSDNSVISFYLDIDQLKITFPDYMDRIDNMIDNSDENNDYTGVDIRHHYVNLRNNDVDILLLTKKVYASSEYLPLRKENETIPAEEIYERANPMIALVGDYPADKIGSYLLKENFIEKHIDFGKTYEHPKENFALTIVGKELLLLSNASSRNKILTKIVKGEDLKDGILSKYVTKAKKDYDLLFAVSDLTSMGPIDVKSWKDNAGNNSMFIGNLPDELEFKFGIFGIKSNNKQGFKMNIEIETVKDEYSRSVSDVFNKTLNLSRGLLPIMLATVSKEEEMAIEFIENLQKEKFSDAYSMISKKFDKIKRISELGTFWKDEVISKYGNVKKIMNFYRDRIDKENVKIVMVCQTEDKDYFTSEITFNKDKEIIDIRFIDYENEFKKEKISIDSLPKVTKKQHREIINFVNSINATPKGNFIIFTASFSKTVIDVFTDLDQKYEIENEELEIDE